MPNRCVDSREAGPEVLIDGEVAFYDDNILGGDVAPPEIRP